MSETPTAGTEEPDETAAATPPAAPPPPAPPPPAPYGSAPVAYGPGPVGKVRGTGLSIFLFIITLSIYGFVWWYSVHEEMKRHRNGQGLGGAIALVIALVGTVVTGIGPLVLAFLTPDEVGKLYEARGQAKPVSALTGLWYFPGCFIIIGPIIWFAKTNGALNAYWQSLGATA